MNIKSKKNGKGWKSMIVDCRRKIKVVSIYCSLKYQSRIKARSAYEAALNADFGNRGIPLKKQNENR